MKRILLLLLAACSVNDGAHDPPTTPPPPWGVPISGGNMIVTRDGRAVIADADRDRLLIVSTSGNANEDATDNVKEFALAAGSEPGRLVEDAAGRIHIALRGSGELLTLDGDDRMQRHVCGDPRGVAVDGDNVYVACATGELVTVSPTGVTSQQLGRDLRDVIVNAGHLYVTRFHSAELIEVPSGTKIVPPTVKRNTVVNVGSEPTEKVDATPEVAWRTIALPDGSFVMSHQRKRAMQLEVVVGGYTTPCGDGPVESAITHVKPDGTAVAVAPMLHAALPVDVALSPDGSELAFASAGRKIVETMPITALSAHDDDECGDPQDNVGVGVIDDQLGMPTSVAYAPSGDLLIYYPELPALVIHHGDSARTIRLPGPFGYDAGRALFHRQTRSGLACASCHPEGREDGQVWEFGFGPRRTQSLVGGILSRAPFHWNGDMADVDQLMTEVFEQRMAAFTSTHAERVSLGPWLDRIAAPSPVLGDPAAVARGEALFNAPEQGCVSCHQGENFTTNVLADVGTGGMFKTPSLIGVGARAPFLHNGCALTLRDRFGVCGGGEAHGRTAHLTQDEISDLVAYLESL